MFGIRVRHLGRDNSPACVAVASPSNKSDSPVPHTPTPVLGAHQENNSAQGTDFRFIVGRWFWDEWMSYDGRSTFNASALSVYV